jgi:hypothetical protein
MDIYHALLQGAPERLAAFGERLRTFSRDLEGAHLDISGLSLAFTGRQVMRFVLQEVIPLLLGAPFALGGTLLHGLPYRTTALAARLIPHTGEEEATDKIAAGLVFFPLFWCLEAWAILRLGGRLPLVLFLAALVPTGFLALVWMERLARAARKARAFRSVIQNPGLLPRLRQERDGLQKELAALASLGGSSAPDPRRKP